MARHGPMPKHPAVRQRRNKVASLEVVSSGDVVVPDPPKGMLKAQRVSWVEFWESDVASAVASSDLPALRRLWLLRDSWDRAYRIVKRSPMVAGSQGQPVEHPLAKKMDRIQGEIRQLEDRFGLNPSGRARLSVSFVDGVSKAAELNRDYQGLLDEA